MNDKFLEAYKQLDIELKEQGQSVLDYENSLSDGTDKERLKLCRITRNYLSHQDKKFVTCSKEMIKFIEDLTLQIRRKSHTVKDELIRQKTAKHNETLKNILPLISKNPKSQLFQALYLPAISMAAALSLAITSSSILPLLITSSTSA